MWEVSLNRYDCLVFDCDGVILNSNQVKTNAFYNAALPYGESAARALVAHHIENGGISRYMKFQHFLSEIVPGRPGPNFEDLLESYAIAVRKGLAECEIASGLDRLKAKTSAARWMVASGGDQHELREVFERRGLAQYFDAGIYGSPTSKMTIVSEARERGVLGKHALLVGDSKYDWEVAVENQLNFVFVSAWSEMTEWPAWVQENSLTSVDGLKNLEEGPV